MFKYSGFGSIFSMGSGLLASGWVVLTHVFSKMGDDVRMFFQDLERFLDRRSTIYLYTKTQMRNTRLMPLVIMTGQRISLMP